MIPDSTRTVWQEIVANSEAHTGLKIPDDLVFEMSWLCGYVSAAELMKHPFLDAVLTPTERQRFIERMGKAMEAHLMSVIERLQQQQAEKTTAEAIRKAGLH